MQEKSALKYHMPEYEVSAQLLEDLEPGDYVMVHAGVAIAKITEEDDSETEQLMEEFLS